MKTSMIILVLALKKALIISTILFKVIGGIYRDFVALVSDIINEQA